MEHIPNKQINPTHVAESNKSQEFVNYPEIRQIEEYIAEIDEDAIRSLFLKELHKIFVKDSRETNNGYISHSDQIKRFLPKSKVKIQYSPNNNTLGSYYTDREITLNACLLCNNVPQAKIIYLKQLYNAYLISSAAGDTIQEERGGLLHVSMKLYRGLLSSILSYMKKSMR